MPQVQWAVQSYVARALPLSAQRIVNLYAEQAPKDAKSPVVLYGAPGIKSFADRVGDGGIRGMELMDGLLYAVSGCVLYSVDSTGREIALGSICDAASGSSSVALGASQAATATFEITAGTVSVGVNQLASITVGGDNIMSAVDFQTDNKATALVIATRINDDCDITRFSYDSISFSVQSEEGIPKTVQFNSTGTKMFILGTDNDTVFQYTLSTANDLSTASYDNISANLSTIAGGIGWTPTGFVFGKGGEKLYALNTTGTNKAFEFDLSIAYDISTLSHSSKTFETGSKRGIAVSSDGTKMFLGGLAVAEIDQFTLSTAYDITTASDDSATLDVSGIFLNVHNIFVDAEGTQLFVIGIAASPFPALIARYNLSTSWDLSTAVHLGTLDVSSEPSVSHNGDSVSFSSDCSKMFVLQRNDDAVFQYSITNRFFARVIGTTVTIEAVDDTGDANGLPVVITLAGDVQVDDPTVTLDGGFQMPAIISSTGGAGIPLTSPGCVSMSHNQASPSQLVIVDGTNGWIYDTTNGLRQITDTDFFSADVVDFQDQFFVFNRAGTGQFFLSNLNDGTAYLGTDIATAEGDPDNLVALISQRRELWLFGAETIEIWYNSGNADFPFSRFEGGFLERGCAAAFSIAEDDNSLFWLGEDRLFYRADGYQPQRISQHGIEEELRKYVIVDDACAFIYTMGGHKFYVCTFPAEDATWVYDITTGLWHERQSVGMGRWRVSVYADAYGKHLVGDFEKGRIGELDLDTFEEYGEVMQGQATGPSVYADRQRIFHRRFELDIDAGPGLTSGQGSDPQVWLDYSDDGGHMFSARKPFRSMGKIGAYLTRLRWLRLGQARQRIYRITVSDPVVRSIVAAHLDAEAGDH